jgi:hypothetical protein
MLVFGIGKLPYNITQIQLIFLSLAQSTVIDASAYFCLFTNKKGEAILIRAQAHAFLSLHISR